MQHGVMAMDLGGTSLKFALVDSAHHLHAEGSLETGRAGGRLRIETVFREAIARMREAAHERNLRPVAAGLGTPGIVDPVTGSLKTPSPNLPGMGRMRLSSFLTSLAGVPAVVENDANLMAFAEARIGAGSGRRVVVGVTVGTGIGAGIVMDGRIVNGAHGVGGELGHTVFVAGGLPCGHGGRGCLELYASATAMVATYAAGGRGGAPAGGAREIFLRARAGERRALRAVRSAAEALGLGLANVANFLDPDVIVVGGGVADAGRFYLDLVRAAFSAQAMGGARRTPIVRARLGNRAGSLGAGLLAFDALGGRRHAPAAGPSGATPARRPYRRGR